MSALEYPAIARRAGVPGVAVLDEVIGTDGRIGPLAAGRRIPAREPAAPEGVRHRLRRLVRMRGCPAGVGARIRVELRMD